jgi:hypothetical protein
MILLGSTKIKRKSTGNYFLEVVPIVVGKQEEAPPKIFEKRSRSGKS